MQFLKEAIAKERVLLDLDARDLRSVFDASIGMLVARGAIPADAHESVVKALLEREAVTSTAISRSIAIPHAYLDALETPVVGVVRLAKAINLGAPDGIPTRLFFFLLGPPGAAAHHLELLAGIARLSADDAFRFDAFNARTPQELLPALDRFVVRTTQPTPRVPEKDEALAFTGRPFGGVLTDIRRRLPAYASDFRDGLNTKSLASTVFLFFACIAPAVTFGGVMAVETDGQIGVVEMLLATAFCGICFSLLGGQPLIILGATGPLLIFTAMLYVLCKNMEIDFLYAYAWVGIWTAALTIILAITDASFLMRYFTRFTDEIFAALISLIFIHQAIIALVDEFRDTPPDGGRDTALLSLLLALGTFYVATNLSQMRKSRFLMHRVREFLADFGPSIALAAMTLVAIWLHEVDLEVLAVPDRLGTTTGRPWLVNLFEGPKWVIMAAIGPAILVTVLVFLDQNITSRLINSPDHKLRKGAAYHLDLVVVGGLIGICSFFGLPWLVAATVRSLNHVRSLATVEEITNAAGSKRSRILHVNETRVTGLGIHVLIGLSLLLLPLLKTVPMAVLYGLFLYMGVVSMGGNQFFERMGLWFMESALYPTTHYIRRVPVWTIHKFTFLQLVCLVMLWVVKSSAWALFFPLFIAVLVPVRMLAGRFFNERYLAALDAEEEPDDEATHWTG